MSSEMTIRAFLLGHIVAWCRVFRLTVFANTNDTDLLARHGLAVDVQSVAIVRPVHLLADVKALWMLTRRLRRERFDAVLSITPKAGLLAMLSAFIARVPVRLHVFTGQVWATRSGAARWVFKTIDRLTASVATHVLVDGEPQRQFLLREGVVRADKSRVLLHGSLCGVDASRFKPDAAARLSLRQSLGVGAEEVAFLFLGRFNRDKGVLDLARAFAGLAALQASVRLFLVGPDEGGLRTELEVILSACRERVHFEAFTATPEAFMQAADVFCLPSYREGFPTSILEAAACGLPALASRIYGIEGALLDGEGGLLHEPGDVAALQAGMARLAASGALREKYAVAARERAMRDFAAPQVIEAFAHYLVAVTEKS
ncbi:glycosyltransferase [Viridibacterium curvum]|uniref:glycosyltransferase n=1 Tax=Viridibacterium curvum TaxID=1101404 RepID=UPI0031ED33C6